MNVLNAPQNLIKNQLSGEVKDRQRPTSDAGVVPLPRDAVTLSENSAEVGAPVAKKLAGPPENVKAGWKGRALNALTGAAMVGAAVACTATLGPIGLAVAPLAVSGFVMHKMSEAGALEGASLLNKSLLFTAMTALVGVSSLMAMAPAVLMMKVGISPVVAMVTSGAAVGAMNDRVTPEDKTLMDKFDWTKSR